MSDSIERNNPPAVRINKRTGHIKATTKLLTTNDHPSFSGYSCNIAINRTLAMNTYAISKHVMGYRFPKRARMPTRTTNNAKQHCKIVKNPSTHSFMVSSRCVSSGGASLPCKATLSRAPHTWFFSLYHRPTKGVTEDLGIQRPRSFKAIHHVTIIRGINFDEHIFKVLLVATSTTGPRRMNWLPTRACTPLRHDVTWVL